MDNCKKILYDDGFDQKLNEEVGEDVKPGMRILIVKEIEESLDL